jgi:hypothetical protein
VKSGKIEAVGKPAGCKLIRIKAEVEGGIIRAISITGDFFASPEEGFERAEARLVGAKLNEVGRIFDKLLAEENVACVGICGAGIDELIRSTVAK